MKKIVTILFTAVFINQLLAHQINFDLSSDEEKLIVNDQMKMRLIEDGNDSDYVFSAPAGWTESSLNGMKVFESPLLECTSYSYYTLYCMHAQSYTGDLLEYVKNLHASLYAGNKNDPYVHYEPNNEFIVKGTNEQGLEYISYCTDAQKIIDTKTPDHDIFWQYYMVYVIKNGNTIYPFLLMEKPYNYHVGGQASTVNGFTWSCKPLEKAWKKFETSITINNAQAATIENNEAIAGVWSSSVHTGWSGLAGGQYAVENTQVVNQFEINDNGTFIRKQATKSETKGIYSIKQNEITFKESNAKTYTYTWRLQSVFEFGHWKRRLFLADKTGNTLELIEKD